MGHILAPDGLTPADKLLPGQWILHLIYDGDTKKLYIMPDKIIKPASTPEEEKIILDNNFSLLCNALAKIVVARDNLKETEEVLLGKKVLDGKMHWCLHLIMEPTTKAVAIYRDDKTNILNDEREAGYYDYMLVANAVVGQISNFMEMGVPGINLINAVKNVIHTYRNSGGISGNAEKIKVDISIVPDAEKREVTPDQTNKEAKVVSIKHTDKPIPPSTKIPLPEL